MKLSINLFVFVWFLYLPNYSIGAESFLCTGGSFKDKLGLNKGKPNGECVLYVRYETGIQFKACNGPAYNCYQQARDKGYVVGKNPRVSSIVVFAADSSKEGLGVGHVGIVTNVDGNNITIRDSNWTQPYTVGEHTEDITKYNILGYIYCDGADSNSEQVAKNYRTVSEVGWYPANKTCVNASEWVKISNGEAVASYVDNSACFSAGFEYVNDLLYQHILFGTDDLPEVCTQ